MSCLCRLSLTMHTTSFVCEVDTVVITLTNLVKRIERSRVDKNVSLEDTDHQLAVIVSSLCMSLVAFLLNVAGEGALWKCIKVCF